MVTEFIAIGFVVFIVNRSRIAALAVIYFDEFIGLSFRVVAVLAVIGFLDCDFVFPFN